MTIKKKEFDCIKFKEMLQANVRKKTVGLTPTQYIDYINSEAKKYNAGIRKTKGNKSSSSLSIEH